MERKYIATGRRKNAVARVRLIDGKGEILVNERKGLDYFKRETLILLINQPFMVTNSLGKYDVIANVGGGGLSGQAGAVQLGISRALVKLDESVRKALRSKGLLTRDSRMVERKKYGQKKARKRFQFSKR
jgi:small subunit ribosomal protein S9